jgi:hypothetical protein
VTPVFADLSAHLGAAAAAIAVAFCGGVYGHVIKSRALILTAIVVIAALSIYFVITGEAQTGGGSALP